MMRTMMMVKSLIPVLKNKIDNSKYRIDHMINNNQYFQYVG